MQLELVSLSGIKYADNAYEVIIPTADGDIAVYPGHMPLISLAVPGMLAIRKQKTDPDSAREYYAVLGGVVEIGGDTVRILVDEVEHAEDLYAEEIKSALERAKKMKAEATSAVDLERAQAMVDRQAVRLKVAELHGHRRTRR